MATCADRVQIDFLNVILNNSEIWGTSFLMKRVTISMVMYNYYTKELEISIVKVKIKVVLETLGLEGCQEYFYGMIL
jgi:hypothetical protein